MLKAKTRRHPDSFPYPAPVGLASCPSQIGLRAPPGSSPCQCLSLPVELQSPAGPTPATTPGRSWRRSSRPLQAILHMATRGSSPTQVSPFCLGGPQGLSPQALLLPPPRGPRPVSGSSALACPPSPPRPPAALRALSLAVPPEFLPAWFPAGAFTLQVSAQTSSQRGLPHPDHPT